MSALGTQVEEHLIDTAAAFKAADWRAFTPRRPHRTNGSEPALVIVGCKRDGWTRLVSLYGDDRYTRAERLVERYNAVPTAAPA